MQTCELQIYSLTYSLEIIPKNGDNKKEQNKIYLRTGYTCYELSASST